MSLTRSQRVSSTTPSATSLARLVPFVALAGVLACTPKLKPPTAVAAGPSTVHVGVPVLLDGTKSTPATPPKGSELLPISYSWSFLGVPAGSHAALNDTTLAQPSFTPDLVGSYEVQLVVSDGVFSSAPSDITLQATDDCRPAVASVTATPSSPAVGQPVALTFQAAPACQAAGQDGAIVGWKWTMVAAPAGSHAELTQAHSPQASLVPDLRGDYQVALVVTNGLGLSSDPTDPNALVKVSPLACGDNPPEVDEISPQPAAPDVGETVQLTAHVSDADTVSPCTFSRTYSYAWDIVSLPAGSKASLNDRAATNPSFTPDLPGQYVVALVVTDDLGRSSARLTFVIDASVCGSATPVVTAVAPATAYVGEGIQLGAKVEDSDNPAANGLNSLGAPGANAGGAPGDSDGGTVDGGLPDGGDSDAGLSDAGSADAGGTDAGLSDGGSADAGETDAGLSDGGSTDAGEADGGLSDGGSTDAGVTDGGVPDGGVPAACSIGLTFSYHWQLLTIPLGSKATLNDPNLANPSVTVDEPGDYTLSVVVTASTGKASAPSLATIHVAECGSIPPVATIQAPAGAITQAPVQLAATVTDQNSDCDTVEPYSYAWIIVSAPAGSSASLSGTTSGGTSAESAPSFVPDLAGSYLVRLVVTDQVGLESVPVFATVVAGGCNVPLNVAIQAPAGAVTGSQVALSATVDDPNAPPDPVAGDGGETDAGSGTDAGTQGASTCSAAVLPYEYQWSIVGQPVGSHASLNNPGAAAPSFSADTDGTYTLQLVVTDAAGNRSPQVTAQVVVANCTAPLTVAIDPISAAATGVGVQLAAQVTDPNAPDPSNSCTVAVLPYAYLWAIVGLPTGSHASLNDPTSVSPSFTPDVDGQYQVSLQVTDAAGNKSPTEVMSFSTTGACDAPPVVTIAAATGATGVPLQLLATVDDPNAPSDSNLCTRAVTPDSYQWSLVGLPAGSHATLNDPASQSPSFTPDVAGTYTAELVVTDALGIQSAAATKDIDIQAVCNAPPEVVIVAPAGGAAGVPLALSATVTDPNDPNTNAACVAATTPYAYRWSLVGLPPGSHAMLNEPAGSAPSFTPDLAGTYRARLVVTDAAGNTSAPVEQDIDVSSDCTAPLSVTINAPAGTPVGLAATFSATVTDSNDPSVTKACVANVAPYAYQWSLVGLPPASHATLNNPVSSAPTLVPDALGSYTVRLVVTDAVGNQSPPEEKTVDVTASCVAPLTASIDTVTGAASGVPVQLTATVQDPDTPDSTKNNCTAATAPYAYVWSLVALPAGSHATLDNAASSAPTLTPDETGSYTVELAVEDAAGNESPIVTRDIDVTASCNAALTATIDPSAGPISGTAAVPVVLGATVTDPNDHANDSLCPATLATTPYSYAWSLIALPATSRAQLLHPTSAAPVLVPDVAGTANNPAVYTVALQVTDALGYKSTVVNKDIDVASACNSRPSVTTIAPDGGTTIAPIQVSATVSDTNTGASCAPILPYTYQWSLVGLPTGSRAALNDPSAQEPSFMPDVYGTYTVQLVVTDAAGNQSAAVTHDVVVSQCNAPLTGGSIGVTGTASTHSLLTFSASGSDPNVLNPDCGLTSTSPIALQWWLVSRPPGSNAGLSATTIDNPTLVPDVVGTYVVAVRATDALGNTGSTSLDVAVDDCGSNPTATVGANPSHAETGQKVQLSAAAEANDVNCAMPTAAPFSYAWTLTPPAGTTSSAALDNARSATPAFVPDVAGTYLYAVTVTDALGYSATTTGSVSAFACPMTLTPSSNPANPVETYSDVSVSAQVSFPNSCVIRNLIPVSFQFGFNGLPPGSKARMSPSNVDLVGVPMTAVSSFNADTPGGTWEVAVTATDQLTGATATRTVQVDNTDLCGLTPPTAEIGATDPNTGTSYGPTIHTAPNCGGAWIPFNRTEKTPINDWWTLDGSQSNDPNTACISNPLTYRWQFYQVPPQTSAILQPWNAAIPTVDFDQDGDYVVELSVSDGKLTSDPSYLCFRVRN